MRHDPSHDADRFHREEMDDADRELALEEADVPELLRSFGEEALDAAEGEQIPQFQLVEWIADARGRLGKAEVEIIELTERVARLEQKHEDLYYGRREQLRDAAAEHLRARVEALEAPAHDLGAALRCQQEASEGLAHLYELLTVKVRTLEGLLLTALVALNNLGERTLGWPNPDVSGAVELLREAIGKENP